MFSLAFKPLYHLYVFIIPISLPWISVTCLIGSKDASRKHLAFSVTHSCVCLLHSCVCLTHSCVCLIHSCVCLTNSCVCHDSTIGVPRHDVLMRIMQPTSSKERDTHTHTHTQIAKRERHTHTHTHAYHADTLVWHICHMTHICVWHLWNMMIDMCGMSGGSGSKDALVEYDAHVKLFCLQTGTLFGHYSTLQGTAARVDPGTSCSPCTRVLSEI